LFASLFQAVLACLTTKDFGVITMSTKLEVYLKGKKLPMNEFVENIFNDVLLAILNNLRDVEIEKISKIEIE
jgi:hypothetical protein